MGCVVIGCVSRKSNKNAIRRLYSLTQKQAQWLTRARDTDGGAYVPITEFGPEPGQLVDGGAATYREIQWTSNTPSLDGKRLCEGTDIYLEPTEYGIELLRKSKG